MKFSNKMRLLSIVFLAGALFNLGVNLWLVPVYGYQWAAISTLITYFLIVLFLAFYDTKLIGSALSSNRKLGVLLGALALQTLVLLVVDNFDLSSSVRIALGLIFVLSYAWLVKRTGILQPLTESK